MTISLRNYRYSDIQCLKEIRADYDLQQALMASPNQTPENDVEGWLERRETDGVFRVIDDGLGNAIGFIQIQKIHRKSKYGWLGIALHSRAQGKRIGYPAMCALHELANKDLNLRKLLLEVRSDNIIAIKLYERLEYRTIGKLREHYFDGRQLHDVVLMEKLLVTA